MHARIWYEPDGIKITTFAAETSADDRLAACRTLQDDGRVHPAATFDDVESDQELKTLLPADRKDRNAWVKATGRRGVAVDPAKVGKPK